MKITIKGKIAVRKGNDSFSIMLAPDHDFVHKVGDKNYAVFIDKISTKAPVLKEMQKEGEKFVLLLPLGEKIIGDINILARAAVAQVIVSLDVDVDDKEIPKVIGYEIPALW